MKGQGEGREELVSGAGLELGGGNSGWHRRRGEEIEKGGGGGMVEMCRRVRWGGGRLEWMYVSVGAVVVVVVAAVMSRRWLALGAERNRMLAQGKGD